MEILGLPFHIYNHEGRTICFFRPEAFISIVYNEKTEMPDIIKFNFTGVISPEEIPEKLGIKSLLPPAMTPEYLLWNDVDSFVKIEIKYSDLRIDGENIYDVSLYLPPASPPIKKDLDKDRYRRHR